MRPVPVRQFVLPLGLAAFAAGVVLLQWQPELPSIAPWLVAAGVTALFAAVLRACLERLPGKRVVIAALASLAAGMLGFGYAAWRAQQRLADALAPEWEGADIAVVGVIDDLPQTAARSARFAFAVERSETPNAVVPATCRSPGMRRQKRTARSTMCPTSRPVSAGASS